MSGIAASFGEIDRKESKSMLERLKHRAGATESSVNIAGNWIGSRYSASAAGTQPVISDDKSLAMVIDGEIYGTTDGGDAPDLKTVLNRFQSGGAESLASLDAAFSMIIASEDGRMMAARDRIGIKPLYWARKDGTVRFASEVGAFGPEWMPAVEFFPPGYSWSQESGLVRFAPDIREQAPTPIGKEETSERRISLQDSIRECLVESVHREMNEDTSVVAFLSGGLDSSLIAAIASQWMTERGEKLRTYAVGMEGSPDLTAAQEVADYLGTDHVEVTYTEDDALAAVPEVVGALENFDPSLVRSSVANYLLAERVSREADVALSGEGADELFAGYQYLRGMDSHEELDRELRHLIAGMHQGGLQRVDRTTMAHGLQARMPFLTSEMVDLAMDIPASLKRADETHPEKQLLREAFRGWLPDEILWRKKAQFGDGSGAVDALSRDVCQGISASDLEESMHSVEPPIRTREELAYYRLFAEALPGARAEAIVGRFATA